MKKSFYEVTYIVRGDVTPEKAQEVFAKYNTLLGQYETEFVESDEWGLKQLQYAMQKQTTGYYINQYVRATAEAMVQLEKYIRIDENVVRYMFLKYDNKMIRHYELKKAGKLRPVFIPQEPEAVITERK